MRGFGLVEIVVGTAVLAASIFGISLYYGKALEVSARTGNLIRGSFLLEESLEVVKHLRDGGWSNIQDLSAGTSYYLTWNGTTWTTSTTNVFVDGFFERRFTVEDVYRDGNDDIISSGGTLDVGTRKVTATVAWREKSGTTTRSVATYLTDVFN